MNDETRVGQLFCPILSTPASVNKAGKEVPAALMPCREKACALYRPLEKRCVLYEVPDVMDRVSAMRASTLLVITPIPTAIDRRLSLKKPSPPVVFW